MMYFVETPSDPHVHSHQGTFFIVKNSHANFLRVVLNLQEMHYIFTKNLFFFPGGGGGGTPKLVVVWRLDVLQYRLIVCDSVESRSATDVFQ